VGLAVELVEAMGVMREVRVVGLPLLPWLVVMVTQW